MALPEESALLSKIDSLIGRIESLVRELERAISSKLALIPPFIAEGIRVAWNEFVDAMNKFWNQVVAIVNSLGSPGALLDTAHAWSDRVGGPISGQVQSATAGMLRADDAWTGAAADNYRQSIPLQQSALSAVKSTYADGIASALADLAKNIIIFWGGLVVALVTLVMGIISAIMSTASIFGIPAAPVLAVGAALVAATSLSVGSAQLYAGASSADATLRQKLDDNTAFHNGHWPVATV